MLGGPRHIFVRLPLQLLWTYLFLLERFIEDFRNVGSADASGEHTRPRVWVRRLAEHGFSAGRRKLRAKHSAVKIHWGVGPGWQRSSAVGAKQIPIFRPRDAS
jgi:hypothetical protein